MDDDLQHPPEAIDRMVRALGESYDVCYTTYLNRQHAAWKKAGSKFNDWVATRLLGKPKGLYLSSFKALRKEVVDEVIKYDGPYAYLDGLILDVTRSITTVDIHHQARHDGKGNYNLVRSLSLWLKMATSFSGVSIAPCFNWRFLACFTQHGDDFDRHCREAPSPRDSSRLVFADCNDIIQRWWIFARLRSRPFAILR
ncbi:hypothetical protein LJR267_002888 [Paraburkholderia hospita]|uniref:hypothetical protein n=1 Tax=Paraburkholderia hospita TaxID=169430 RepID=UPI003ED0390E